MQRAITCGARPLAVSVAILVMCVPLARPQQVAVPLPPIQGYREPPGVEAKVSALLNRMTLTEKVGQLVQYSGGNATGPSPKQGLYEEMIARGEVGSLLNVIGAAETNRYQRLATEKSRLHIPLLFGYDVIHGYRTSFPVPLALAASFSPELVETVAATASREASQDGIRWVFSPMVDIARDARWGRIVESAGEDPFLGAAVAGAWVSGIQTPRSDGAITAACIKHFAAYGAPIAGRDYNAVDMSARALSEVYLPSYRAGIDAGALTVMSSFNSLNGVPMTANRAMLTDLLRTDWGFRGFVVSDWAAVRELISHSVALDGGTAAAKSITAGVDMDMEGDLYRTQLAKLVQSGQVPMAVLDEAVRRVLRVKFEIGLFEHPYTNEGLSNDLSAVSRTVTREAVAQTLVLLKNDSFHGQKSLPITGKDKSLALIGPFADSQAEMLGSWSLPARPGDVVTLRTALAERVGVKLLYAKGTEILTDSTAGFSEALKVASHADVVVMALGESGPDMTGEAASRAHLGLPGNQQKLLEAVVAMGKPVILVLFNGRPLAIPWAAQHVPAILEGWFPGTEAGHAIADVLFGDRDPGGRLPVSMPYSVGQEPLFYAQAPTGRPATKALTGPVPSGISRFNSRYIDEATIPLYPFGWGLTYTNFKFGVPKLNAAALSLARVAAAEKSAPHEQLIGVDIPVTNTGKRAGVAVAQLYLRNEGPSVEQPIRELRGFKKVLLQPDETAILHFNLTVQDLAFYDQQMQRVIEPTRYSIFVGADATTTNGAQFTIVQ